MAVGLGLLAVAALAYAYHVQRRRRQQAGDGSQLPRGRGASLQQAPKLPVWVGVDATPVVHAAMGDGHGDKNGFRNQGEANGRCRGVNGRTTTIEARGAAGPAASPRHLLQMTVPYENPRIRPGKHAMPPTMPVPATPAGDEQPQTLLTLCWLRHCAGDGGVSSDDGGKGDGDGDRGGGVSRVSLAAMVPALASPTGSLERALSPPLHAPPPSSSTRTASPSVGSSSAASLSSADADHIEHGTRCSGPCWTRGPNPLGVDASQSETAEGCQALTRV